jgi:general secretion pathway protein D
MKMNFHRMTAAGCLLAIFLMLSPARSQENFDSTSSILDTDAGQKRIDLDILDMDVESVLKIISDTGGWTIIPSPKVKGKVSLWSKGATPRQLLDKLSLVNNYIYQQEGNIIFLMTKDEYEQIFGRTSKTFYLKHQKVENIKQLLENSLTKDGKLGLDPWSNTIVINDTAENLGKIESLINRLDQGFIQKRFQLVNADAADVTEILNKVCPKEGPFQADVRTNSIIVFNSQTNVERIAELITQLDQDTVTRVFQIKFQKASELAPQISAFLSTSNDPKTPKTTKQIIVSEATNQIIVTASASTVNYIAGLLEELDSKVVTTTIPLKHLKALQVLSQVSNLASKPENITADSQGNQLIIRDNTNNIEQIRKVIQDLDESLVTKVFTLEYAMAADIENVLRTLVTNPDTLRVEARTNQIIICDSSSQVTRIESIIKKLDCKDAYFTRTYHLEHASASRVGSIIEAFLSKQYPQKIYSGTAPKIQSDESHKPDDKTSLHSPITPSPPSDSGPPRTGVALGSAPGLTGMRSSEQTAVSPYPAHPPQSPLPSSPGAAFESPTAPLASESLGIAGTVVADDRSNTVAITETLSTLTRIEQLIKDLDVPVHSYCYTVKYRQLDSLELDSKLANLLRPEEDTFSIDKQTHAVNFITIPSIGERILEMLEQWDKPAKQALIHAKILAVNTGTLKALGINFESLFDISGVDVALEGSLPSQIGADHFGSLTVRKITGTQYQAILRTIETDNRSQILASPRILVLDGRSAEVRMATDEPFTETSMDAENGRTIENVRFLQVGTILTVKPSIKEDNTIEMDIGLDVSSLVEIRNGIPVVNHNIANSTVAVKDNHILMIGGLKFTRDINVKEKIPVLGDLPLAGGLFSSSRNELADTELVLLLQPKIVNASDSTYQPSDDDPRQRDSNPQPSD